MAEKFKYDLEYVDKLSFLFDVKIIIMTVATVFKRDGITMEDMATAMDLGDYLLRCGIITKEEYKVRQNETEKNFK